MLEPVSPRVDAFIRLRKKYNTIAKKIIQEKEGFETLAENKNNASQSMETSKITKRRLLSEKYYQYRKWSRATD
jgi:hypothetical protein